MNLLSSQPQKKEAKKVSAAKAPPPASLSPSSQSKASFEDVRQTLRGSLFTPRGSGPPIP